MGWSPGVHKVNKKETRLSASSGVGRIDASHCPELCEVEPGLRCHSLDLSGTAVERLPEHIEVELWLDLSHCTELRELPRGLRTGSLVLAGCTALEELPDGLSVSFLDISGCTALRALPDDLHIRRGRLNARDCVGLSALCASLGPIAQLDVAGCAALTSLPEGLEVTSWVDIAGTSIGELPSSMAGVHIHWRSVPIDERIAFRPEKISGVEVLAERNAERRRVMLDRVGYARFLSDAEAQILDADTDPGGPRQLLRVELEGDEDLVCVSVQCPSTGGRYLLRVPPTVKTCHQAVAWTAGFDDPTAYGPIVET